MVAGKVCYRSLSLRLLQCPQGTCRQAVAGGCSPAHAHARLRTGATCLVGHHPAPPCTYVCAAHLKDTSQWAMVVHALADGLIQRPTVVQAQRLHGPSMQASPFFSDRFVDCSTGASSKLWALITEPLHLISKHAACGRKMNAVH